MPTRGVMEFCILSMSLGFAALVATVPARAGTIDINYALTGSTTITGVTSTTAFLSGTNTGSFDQADATVNDLWNPVTFTYKSQADLSTGLLTGAFNITMADGETLSGVVNEDLSAILSSPTLTGSYTQVLTFTGGSGEFAGASGSADGIGYEGASGGMVSGSGSLTAPDLAAPEPATFELLLSGLGFVAVQYRRGSS
jgi:hypothetical protein